MALTREELLGLSDAKIVKVAVPAWDNAEVCIRNLTAGQRDYFERLSIKEGGLPENFRSRMVALALCDESGNTLFKPEDFELLAAKSAAALNFLFEEVTKMNAMSGKESVEEVQKNSEATPGDGSTTA